MIKLYCFGESGNAYKVALALNLTATPWEPVFVDFFNGEFIFTSRERVVASSI